MSSLPSKIDALVDLLDEPGAEPPVDMWAEALGTVMRRWACGTPIVDPYAFAEAVVRHYRISGPRADRAHERIDKALRSSAIETRGWGDGSLCAYHNEQMSKRD